MPTNYFVDSTTGNDGDSGLTMDDAFATLEHIAEAALLGPGDTVWIRRIHVEYAGNPTSKLMFTRDGLASSPIKYIGWPRNTHAVISSDWTNGSTAVVVDDADMDREKHLGRFITAPDGEDYLITRVVDASNIVIDREYVGGTVVNQAATIKADEDYALAQAIDDSGWTINKAAWNADADDLPLLDFKATAFYPHFDRATHSYIANIDWKLGSMYIYMYSNKALWFRGCLFRVGSHYLISIGAGQIILFERVIMVGNNPTGGYNLIYMGGGWIMIKDAALYNCWIDTFNVNAGQVWLDNVNVGVEQDTRWCEFYSQFSNMLITGRNVKVGGANGIYKGQIQGGWFVLEFENYQKIAGAYKVFNSQGEITKVEADGAGDKPNQRTGGAIDIYEILYHLSSETMYLPNTIEAWSWEVFRHEFDVDTSAKTYRYYVQSMANLTADQLWIEVEYIDAYDGTTKYINKKVRSDEAVAVRANQNDWSQYIEVPNIAPAVASRVRIKCKCNYQHATNKIYIDPGDFNYLPTSLCAAAGQFIPGIRLHGA